MRINTALISPRMDKIIDGIVNNSIGRIIGILAVVILAAAVLLVIEIQPRVGAPEAIGLEITERHTLENKLEVSNTGEVGLPDVRLTIVMSEWGYTVDGQAATISSDGSLKGALPITVKVGDVVEITLSNTGKIVHDFNVALTEGEDHHHEAMEHQAQSLTLNPGETEILTFMAGTAGTYTYHCGIPGHTELGMLGSFVIIAEGGEQEHLEHDEDEHHEEEHHEEE